MGEVRPITVLHLSDMQFGKNHRFGVAVTPEGDNPYDTLRERLILDLRKLREDHGLVPDLMILTGDLAEWGKKPEFEGVLDLIVGLEKELSLARDRLIVIPGNHDINRDACEAYFKECSADDLTPDKPYWPKWRHYAHFFGQLYRDMPKYVFSEEQHWTLFEVKPLKVVVAGLNSTIAESHKEIDKSGNFGHYGWLGEPQCQWFAKKLATYKRDGWLRIGVVHHNVVRGAELDDENLRDASDLKRILGTHLNCILHGHTHEADISFWIDQNVPTLSTGSAAVNRDARPDEVPNQYQIIQFWAERIVRYSRAYDPRGKKWIPDARIGEGAITGQQTKQIQFQSVHAAFLDGKPSGTPSLPPPLSRYERELYVLEGYLNALVRNHAALDPRGIKTTKVQVVLPLDEIYVGLQADRDRPDVDRRVMQEELDEIKKRLERVDDPKEREKQYQIWARLARTLERALEVSGPREDLSNIVQRDRQVVILGDPGSGKTTLVRYLTLRFARAILAEPERIFQPQDLWDDKTVWRLPALGPVRLPIFLRIANYAEARQKDPDLSLVDYLPRYFAGLQVPHADEVGLLLRRMLDEGRCIVLLDGLDEIIKPADRLNIAVAIGQFAGVYRETGLPDWLARSLAFVPAPVEEKLEANAAAEEKGIIIGWAKNVPEDVRQGWEKQIKQQSEQWRRRGGRAQQLAWELLREARYAHVGNRFVVTSRIAGYHFAGVPGEFEHYTIRRMSLDDIKLFLEKWCPAVERRIADAPDPAQVEQRARREIDGILQSVETTPGVRRMAENPLLLRILAIIHRNEAHLPQRRVELYDTATVTLLRDWNLERGAKDAVIDDARAMSLLGPVAFHIHEKYASGFLSKGETEQVLGRILARERGEDPEQPSLATREATQQFLETVREHSGLFVERGEGLYGFMHLSFEEYFTARHLVSSSGRARSQILERLHLPRWREPILLAVGSLSKQFYNDTHELLLAILEADSPYERVLHRDLLFAAACVGDSVNVALWLRQQIAGRLLFLYCDRRHAGRYRLLQNQVKEVLLTLCNDQGDAAVEAALAEKLMSCADHTALTCALEATDWLKARTSAVAHALSTCSDPRVLPRTQELLRAVQTRLPVNGNSARPASVGWDAVRENAALTQLLGAMWHYGWRYALARALRVADQGLREIAAEAIGSGLRGTLRQLYNIAQRLEEPTIGPDSVAEFKDECRRLSYEIRRQRLELGEPGELELDYELWRLAISDRPPEELAHRIRRLLRRYAVPELAPSIAAEIQARFKHLEWRLRRLEDTPEASVLARREVACFAQKLEVHVRGSDMPGLRAAVRKLERLSDDLASRPGPPDVRAVLLRAREALEVGADRENLPEQLSRWGGLILHNTQGGGTLATLFAARAARLIPLQPLPDDDTLRASVEAIQADLADSLLETLRHADVQGYSDAALFLACTGEGKIRDDTVAIVLGDLEGTNATRRRLALQVLTEHALREHVPFTDAQRRLLLSLLDEPADQATPALDILFALGLTPDLLAGCWAVLRRPDHPLADAVREKLEEIKEIRGERQFLALLDEGRRDASLRMVSLELLRRVSWQGAETFVQVLAWLTEEDIEVRHLAVLLLAGQDDLLAAPRNVLVAAQQGLTATVPGWAALCDDAPLVRLLGGLWLSGWDEVLTQMWVAQPAVTYVDSKHPSKYWRSFRSYPESEECIRWLLEKAEFGQPLIPTFQSAAARLAELEGASAQGAPQAKHIAAVQREISQQVDTLLAQPDTPLVLATEAKILAEAARQEAIPRVFAANLQAALERADERDWAVALGRLAGRPNQQSLVVAALNQAGLHPWLRSLVTTERDLPLALWLRQTLAAHGLTPDAPPAVLAGLLTAENADARLAASLALFAADLPALLVRVLEEAALSQDDRVRFRACKQFYAFCHKKLPTDGSTQIIEWLQHTHQTAEAYEATMMVSAIAFLDYQSTYWPGKWIEAIREGNDEKLRFARAALQTIGRPSRAVIQFICGHLSCGQPTRVREAAVCSLLEIRQLNEELRSDTAIHAALTTALNDPDTGICRSAACALQWTAGQGLWPVAQALLCATQSHPDSETRALALRSTGRVLHAVLGYRDVDVSKEALFRWLEAQCIGRRVPTPTTPGWDDITEVVKSLPSLAVLKETPDAGAVLDALAHPDALELPDETVTQLCGAQEWDRLLQSARQEWESRQCWLVTLPHLPAAIVRVKALLDAPEPPIRRAAACALAWLYHGEDDRPGRLRDLLPNDTTLLQALLDAITDRDSWGDEGRGRVSHHPWAVKQIAGWVEARPPEERARLIAGMLDNLESTMVGMEVEEWSWSPRRALVAVLAELSERLTYRAFTSSRDLVNVVTLFARAAADPNSYNTRRFAIRTLGNLQQLTAPVADVFFAACQDVGDVYHETRTAVSKFKSFSSGSLERLTASICSPSITVAYHAALLLGELGVSRSEDLGREGRQRVADELVRLLDDPLSERIVYDFSKGSDGERVGPLCDVIYEALMRVVAGPDAPTSQVTAEGETRAMNAPNTAFERGARGDGGFDPGSGSGFADIFEEMFGEFMDVGKDPR